nr:YqaJ viral recombinase family protein [Photobacterium leiognathi]
MAIVDLVQRTEAWFDWRKEGITASMIPVIMGLSAYQTPYQLWAEFVGLKEPDDLSGNYHVQRGVEQEPESKGSGRKRIR